MPVRRRNYLSERWFFLWDVPQRIPNAELPAEATLDCDGDYRKLHWIVRNWRMVWWFLLEHCRRMCSLLVSLAKRRGWNEGLCRWFPSCWTVFRRYCRGSIELSDLGFFFCQEHSSPVGITSQQSFMNKTSLFLVCEMKLTGWLLFSFLAQKRARSSSSSFSKDLPTWVTGPATVDGI